VARRDVGDMDELQQILWYVAGQSMIGQGSNLVGNALQHTRSQCKLSSASVM